MDNQDTNVFYERPELEECSHGIINAKSDCAMCAMEAQQEAEREAANKLEEE